MVYYQISETSFLLIDRAATRGCARFGETWRSRERQSERWDLSISCQTILKRFLDELLQVSIVFTCVDEWACIGRSVCCFCDVEVEVVVRGDPRKHRTSTLRLREMNGNPFGRKQGRISYSEDRLRILKCIVSMIEIPKTYSNMFCHVMRL